MTGGASGIGRAIASSFAVAGGRVAVLDLAAEGAAEVAAGCGEESVAFACDVTDPSSVSEAVGGVLGRFGRIDVLVNCAGIALIDAAEDLAPEQFDATVAVNLRGAFLLCQQVGRHMLAAGGGRIVNVASQAASVGLEGHAAYCASKAGLVGLTKVLALEWGGRGISVNTVSPTVVLTELGKAVWSGERERRSRP